MNKVEAMTMYPKKLIVSSLNPKIYTTRRFLEESNKLNYSSSEHINPFNFIIPPDYPLNSRELPENQLLFLHRTTGIHFDDFDLLVAKHFELSGYKVSNPLSALINFRNKDSQALFLKSNNIEIIKSLIFRGDISQSLKEQIEALSPTHEFVLKTNRGNQGIGVSFINSLLSLYSVLETMKALGDQKFLIQPFIPHTKEYRVFIIKGDIHAVIEKTISQHDFRANANRAKSVIKTDIENELKDFAIKAFSTSGLDYAGLDILRDQDGRPVLIEINSVCGFEQIETLSSHNIAREILLALH